MENNREQDRQRAVDRHGAGERAGVICQSLRYSRTWFYKWLKRSQAEEGPWYQERCRRPHENPNRTAQEIEEVVKMVRLELYNQGLFCGPQAIQWQMEDLAVKPLPSQRTIARILARHELTNRRTGCYEPKGTKYPQWVAQKPGDVHQTDYVGPCYLKGPVRFYNLNSVDVATGRCATEPVVQKAKQHTLDALWATWLRLGLPHYQQFDNEMVFYGSPTHPRGMGQVIRLCLRYGVEPCFIPLREPWRNGVVEKFNHHWLQDVLNKVPMRSVADLKRENLAFEERHNTRYRYSKLGGKTPLQALATTAIALRFPPMENAPRYPLPKPQDGQYHLIRFIRSNGKLDIFGEQFMVPPEAIYEYVRATIEVAQQKLSVYLDHILIDEQPYSLG